MSLPPISNAHLSSSWQRLGKVHLLPMLRSAKAFDLCLALIGYLYQGSMTRLESSASVRKWNERCREETERNFACFRARPLHRIYQIFDTPCVVNHGCPPTSYTIIADVIGAMPRARLLSPCHTRQSVRIECTLGGIKCRRTPPQPTMSVSGQCSMRARTNATQLRYNSRNARGHNLAVRGLPARFCTPNSHWIP
jgi:hypothetical protein